MGASRLVPPATAQRIESERGSIAYWELSRTVYLTEVRGFMTRDMAELIVERADPLYRGGSTVYGFHNWFDMENYESACRVELTGWVLRHRTQTSLHIGLTSRLVAMGVAVANLALGSLIHVHDQPRSLEDAVHAALRAVA